MFEVSAALKSAEDLDKAVGILAKLVSKVRAKPDLAAQKLGLALGEVARTLEVVINATSEFLSLAIDEGALSKNSKLLLEIDGGSLRTEVERGRGHCHLIYDIYSKYLDKWFARAFSRDDYAQVKKVFRELGDADGTMFYQLENVAVLLEGEAALVLDLVQSGQEETARARIMATLPVLRPLRKTISNTMQAIYSMRSDFVSISRAV